VGESRVRILNAISEYDPLAGSDSLDIDMALAGDTVRLRSLKFLAYNQYMSMRSGALTLTLRKSSNGHVLWKGTGTLPSGYFTIIPNGSLAHDDISVSVLRESDEQAQQPMMQLNAIPFDTTHGALRMVNLRSASEGLFARFSPGDSSQAAAGTASRWWSEQAGTVVKKIEFRGAQTVELPSVVLRSDTLSTLVVFGASTPYPDVRLLDAPARQSVSPGKCALRIFNAIVGSGNLDLRIQASGSPSAITVPLPYGEPTAYTAFDAGTTIVQVYPAGTTTILRTLNGVLPAGAVATMLVTGTAASPVVELLIDSDSSAQSLKRFDAIASLPEERVADGIVIRPNPAATRVEVWLDENGDESGTVEMYDMQGGLAYSTRLAPAAGRQSAVIELDALPAGIYSLIVRRRQHTAVRRLVVVH
jgi:hypothetical protein